MSEHGSYHCQEVQQQSTRNFDSVNVDSQMHIVTRMSAHTMFITIMLFTGIARYNNQHTHIATNMEALI